MLKKLLLLDKSNTINFGVKFSFLTFLFTLIPLFLTYIISGKLNIEFFIYLFSYISITIAFYLYKYKSQISLTWIGFIKTGSLIAVCNSLFFYLLAIVFKINAVPLIPNIILFGIIYSVLAGIFFEKAPLKSKLKRLLTLIIFVWGIYIFIRRLMDSSKSDDGIYGVDTDGDGKNDSFDTNGDGMIDMKFIDSDGDGTSDMIAMDTNKDGIIDTVAADINRDGKIDSIITKKA